MSLLLRQTSLCNACVAHSREVTVRLPEILFLAVIWKQNLDFEWVNLVHRSHEGELCQWINLKYLLLLNMITFLVDTRKTN